jgi:hypothetical protein
MIKGSLKDVSLPGLLQFLANENKSYRVKVEKGSLYGDVVVSNGHVISAAYGLLRGEDALCEFMTWDEGIFYAERLPSRFEATVEKNVSLRLHQGTSFADQAAFLLEDNVGLNTVVRPSRMFGTPEWQESSKLQPLQREDFLILGWLSDGRTMRQAMREFAFDLIQSTAILYRLLLTRSVEVVRTTGPIEVATDLAASERDGGATVRPAPEAAVQVVAPVAEAAPPPAEAPPVEAVDKTTLRTTVLPIASIDIERLMKACFTISEFGFLALKNPMLDETIRSILLKVEEGKTVDDVVLEAGRHPAAVLSTYRYCIERGYINNPDSVLPLTADLLLGRTEIDQYLLQRRRVTGEQLRDLVVQARTQGIKLPEMLVKSGFLSPEDLEAVEAQRRRFSQR